MDPTQAKIIDLLREVHLLALKEIERLNMRIAELESEIRQQPAPEVAKQVEKRLPAVTPAPLKPKSPPEPPRG